MANAVLSVMENKKENQWPAQKSAWSKAFEIFCKSVFKAYCPLKAQGRENLPKAPYLLCSNHASHIDSAALMVAAGLPFKKTALIAAKDYFFDDEKRFFLHYLMNLIPIARGSGTKALKESIDVSRAFLENGGQALIMYPEGTRSKTGQMGKFKEGAAILAHDLDMPLVPAYILGSYDSLPKNAYMLRPHKVVVSFGKAFKVSNYISPKEPDSRKALIHAYREATHELERRVHDLENENLKR